MPHHQLIYRRNIPLNTDFLSPNQFLLDQFTGAVIAYSLRKLRTGVTRAVRIRRDSDNAEQDFGFDSLGNFDIAEAQTFVGAGSGFITTWYDQSGFGIDISSVGADQPFIISSGVVSTLRNYPCVEFAHGPFLDRSNTPASAFGSGTSVTVFSVFQQRSGDTASVIFFWTAPAQWGIAPIDNAITQSDFDFGSLNPTGRIIGPVFTYDTPLIVEAYRDSSNNQELLLNGITWASGVRTDTLSGTDILTVGRYSPGLYLLDGLISEIIIWGTDMGSAKRNLARGRINQYYGIM